MKKETDPVRRQLDHLLAEIGAKKNAIAFMENRLAAEIERVAAQWDPEIQRAEEDLKAIEAELVGVAKFHKAALFADGRDRLDLKHGALIRQVQKRVVKVKKMLARLKAAGMKALIKVVESPDWDGIEKLSDDELKRLGTRRKPKEIFAYEIKGV